MYATLVGSKHESEYVFQNLTTYFTKVQTLGGIILLGRDFNAHIATLLDTINISDLCELLQVLEVVKIE
jgi:hypothetical protein